MHGESQCCAGGFMSYFPFLSLHCSLLWLSKYAEVSCNSLKWIWSPGQERREEMAGQSYLHERKSAAQVGQPCWISLSDCYFLSRVTGELKLYPLNLIVYLLGKKSGAISWSRGGTDRSGDVEKYSLILDLLTHKSKCLLKRQQSSWFLPSHCPSAP